MANIRERTHPSGRVVFLATYNPTGKRGGKRVSRTFNTRDEAVAYVETLPLDKQSCRGPAPIIDRSRQWSDTAHHVSYTTHVGEVPEGLQLDHLCRVRACCNPAHLEPVTPLVNVRRGITARSAR
jgi:HNH endonuclease